MINQGVAGCQIKLTMVGEGAGKRFRGTVPMNVAWWVMLPIPHSVLVRWILFGLLEMLVSGILVAAIYKPTAPAKAQP